MKPIARAIDTGKAGLLLTDFLLDYWDKDISDAKSSIRKGAILVNRETVRDVNTRLMPGTYYISIGSVMVFNLTII